MANPWLNQYTPRSVRRERAETTGGTGDFAKTRAVILSALERYPEALRAVVEALEREERKA